MLGNRAPRKIKGPSISFSPRPLPARAGANPSGHRGRFRGSLPSSAGPCRASRALSKVTGGATYTADVKLPGMLWAKVLRSPYPHARILRVDTSAAMQVPGVVDVLTGADVEGHYQGKVLRDMPVLCWDRVRYAGDRVAAVAAETPEAADEALSLIEVDYEELPAVFDPLEAMEPDAPTVHEDPREYPGTPGGGATFADDLHNGSTRMAWRKGDLDQGFAEADLVMEHTFTIPSRHQGYLEPYASVVDIDDDGRVQAWCSSKAPFRARQQLAPGRGHPGGADPGQRGQRRRRLRRQGRRARPADRLLPGEAGRASGEDRHDLRRGADGEQPDPSDRDHGEVGREARRHANGAQGAGGARQRRLQRA